MSLKNAIFNLNSEIVKLYFFLAQSLFPSPFSSSFSPSSLSSWNSTRTVVVWLGSSPSVFTAAKSLSAIMASFVNLPRSLLLSFELSQTPLRALATLSERLIASTVTFAVLRSLLLLASIVDSLWLLIEEKTGGSAASSLNVGKLWSKLGSRLGSKLGVGVSWLWKTLLASRFRSLNELSLKNVYFSEDKFVFLSLFAKNLYVA